VTTRTDRYGVATGGGLLHVEVRGSARTLVLVHGPGRGSSGPAAAGVIDQVPTVRRSPRPGDEQERP
jgi:hypothetical protein